MPASGRVEYAEPLIGVASKVVESIELGCDGVASDDEGVTASRDVGEHRDEACDARDLRGLSACPAASSTVGPAAGPAVGRASTPEKGLVAAGPAATPEPDPWSSSAESSTVPAATLEPSSLLVETLAALPQWPLGGPMQ